MHSKSRSGYNALPDHQSKADFIVNVAASRLGISDDKFKIHLSDDLKYPLGEIMDMWDELTEDYGIDLSSKDFPEISSIDKLRHKLTS